MLYSALSDRRWQPEERALVLQPYCACFRQQPRQGSCFILFWWVLRIPVSGFYKQNVGFRWTPMPDFWSLVPGPKAWQSCGCCYMISRTGSSSHPVPEAGPVSLGRDCTACLRTWECLAALYETLLGQLGQNFCLLSTTWPLLFRTHG